MVKTPRRRRSSSTSTGAPKLPKVQPHGTRARYYSRTDPCRCDKCRAANAAYVRRQRGDYRDSYAARTGARFVKDRAGRVVGRQDSLFG